MPRFAFLAAVVLASVTAASAQVIVTASGRNASPALDGTSALDLPFTLEFPGLDSNGNLLIADLEGHVIYRVTPLGETELIAGNGFPGFSGDGGPATRASLNLPVAAAEGPDGSIYFTEIGGQRVRKVDPNGIISTLAGNGFKGFFGDGVAAVDAVMDFPTNILVAPNGDIVFSDSGNHVVRAIDRSGLIRTIAGSPGPGFSGDGGPATRAKLNWPQGLAYDAAGSLYIADRFNHIIRQVNTQGTIQTVAGTPQQLGFTDDVLALNGNLYEPWQISLDYTGGLVIADALNRRIRRLNNQGFLTTIAGTGDFSPTPDGLSPLQTNVFFPHGVAADRTGLVYYSEPRLVRRFNSRSGSARVETVAGSGRAPFPVNGTPALAADIKLPQDVAIDPQGRLLVSSSLAHVIFRVNLDGTTEVIAGNGRLGFAGDNGPARQATLWDPRGIEALADGTILFMDTNNRRLRRISPAGIITTIAGNGTNAFPTNGMPALELGLEDAFDVEVSPNGEIYISSSNHHIILKLTPNNTVQIVAGNGEAGFNGDCAVATRCQLNRPRFMDFDDAGNLYFADLNNQRVRRLTPSGAIETVAGNGEIASSGDGGPALNASFLSPIGVAVDPQGDVLVTENNGHVIRKFTPGGSVMTVAGTGVRGLTGDGGPAATARINGPSGIAVDAAGNAYFADRENNRIRAILAESPVFEVSFGTSGPLSFEAQAGDSAPAEAVELRSSVLGLQYQASASDSWLTVDPPAGDVPEQLNVQADASNLAPGDYTGRVMVTAPDANPPTRTVEVRFSVTAGDPAQLGVSPSYLIFGQTVGTRAGSQRLSVGNEGAGTVRFTARASSEQGWLSIDVTEGIAPAGAPATISVTADPSGLPEGTYAGEVILSDDQGVSVRTPVTLSISAAEPILTLSHAGMSFRAQAGGGRPAMQTVGILNTGAGRMSWNASAQTLSGGPSWLRLNATSGEVPRPFQDVSTLEVSVNPAGLAAGDYFGRVDVTSPGNPPETISVLLTVQPAGQPLPPDVTPNAIIFTGVRGQSPSAQELTVTNLGSQPISYASSTNTVQGQDGWFGHSPEGAVVNPNQPQRMIVNPNFDDVSSGILRGSISFQFDDGSVRNVRILGIVADSAAALTEELTLQNACPPLQMELASSGTRIEARLGEPVRMGVKLHDSCGRALDANTPGVKVFASFTNGDPQLQLGYEGDAAWGGDWQPRNQQAQSLTVTLTGILGFSIAQQDITVEVREPSPLPVVEAGAVRNAASFEAGNRVSPGGLISIFGRQLAEGSGAVGGVPFPTQLENTEVVLAGVPLPLLFAADGQINAQAPFNLPLNRQVQMLVKRGNALSVEERLSVSPAQPAIFTLNQQGFGQAAIVDGLTFELADINAPVSSGDVLTAFCTGLGLVDPPTPEGQIAPDSPLSVTVNPVEVFVDGIQAEVLFSGLAPRFAGLYQVNFFVPEGVLPGDSVSVVMRQAGLNSPPVTIAVR